MHVRPTGAIFREVTVKDLLQAFRKKQKQIEKFGLLDGGPNCNSVAKFFFEILQINMIKMQIYFMIILI